MKQVCYIDDSRTSAYVTKKLLKQYGYVVDHFPDAESALDALIENDYELLITDLMISSQGGVNGDDLIRLIRQMGHPTKSGIPIIVVTGSSDLATHDNLLNVGANRVLAKPLDGATLRKAIEELAPQISRAHAPVTSEAPREITKPQSPFQISIDESEKLKDLSEITLPEQIEQQAKPEVPPVTIAVEAEPEPAEVPAEPEPPEIVQAEIKQELFETAEEQAFTAQEKKPATEEEFIPPGLENIPILTETVDQDSVSEVERYLEEMASAKREQIAVTEREESKRRPKPTGPGSSISSDALTLDKFFLDENEISKPREPEPVKSQGIVEEQPAIFDEQTEVKNVQPTEAFKKPVTPPPQIKPKSAAKEDNPLLSLLDHLDNVETEIDRDAPFKSPSLFARAWFRRTLWLIFLLALIVPATTFWYMGQQKIVVQTTPVTTGVMSSDISVPGRVISKRKINISARDSGQLVKIAVKEGDTVKKGQLLIQMDDKEAQSNLNRYQAKLLSMQEVVAQTSKLQERLLKALDVGAVSRQKVEDAE
ncbi:MAG: response regulator, partial [Gammaproteobacteria bacterium]|nr:response regulator [Gammaproteobacteria bacterium]